MYKKFVDKIYNILETKYGTLNKDKQFLLFNINVTVSAVILLVLIVLAIFTTSLSLVYYIGIIALVIFQLISLYLLFKGHFTISVWITIVSITILLWFSIIYNYDYGNHDAFQIFYIVLGIFIFSMLLVRKATLIFMIIQFVALILFVIINPEISDEQNLPALLAFIIAAFGFPAA